MFDIDSIISAIQVNARTKVSKTPAKIESIKHSLIQLHTLVSNNTIISKTEYAIVRKDIAWTIVQYYTNKISEPFIYNSRQRYSSGCTKFVEDTYDHECGITTIKILENTIKKYDFDMQHDNDKQLYNELSKFIKLFTPVVETLNKLLYLQENKNKPKNRK